MSEQDEDYKRQVEDSNQILLDELGAHQTVAEKGEDVVESSWESFLNQLKGLVADDDLLSESRTASEEFRDSLLAHDNVLLQLRGRELRDALNTPKRSD
ncbi:hypothetical protein F4821DRAFT_261524 [Hypoxylon rubiginosum]|uniref:Uncharacterized protein n=1 Tax=Hypoxylon rubiginosum TaxID=110542 RepID=A0ACC0CWP6_9PEZI|nr:hypothetical protein F4821DRAFT_261524 [Hypoxylon rubiginosum]